MTYREAARAAAIAEGGEWIRPSGGLDDDYGVRREESKEWEAIKGCMEEETCSLYRGGRESNVSER